MSQFLQTAAENVGFLLTCTGIFAGLVLLAWLAQRFLLPERRHRHAHGSQLRYDKAA